MIVLPAKTTSDVDFREYDSTLKRCVPLIGYFDNQTTVCAKCSIGCQSCITDSYCQNCSTNYYLNPDSMCRVSCPPRFISNTLTNKCDPCPYQCYTCDNQNKCLSCNGTTDFRVLSGNNCLPMPGYF